jgi:hypothetical protein
MTIATNTEKAFNNVQYSLYKISQNVMNTVKHPHKIEH